MKFGLQILNSVMEIGCKKNQCCKQPKTRRNLKILTSDFYIPSWKFEPAGKFVSWIRNFINSEKWHIIQRFEEEKKNQTDFSNNRFFCNRFLIKSIFSGSKKKKNRINSRIVFLSFSRHHWLNESRIASHVVFVVDKISPVESFL